MNAVRKAWNWLVDAVEGEDDPGEIIYDPVHVAGVIVGSLCVMGLLFWVLWALLVFEGGLPGKVLPLLRVVLTSKTLGDFGYEGYPHQMGVFEGWIGNVAALAAALLLVWGVWRVFEAKGRK